MSTKTTLLDVCKDFKDGWLIYPNLLPDSILALKE